MANRIKSGGSRNQVLIRQVLPVGAGILVLGGLIYWFTRPSADALLNVTSPTPQQIREIASNLLLHEDYKIRTRAGDRLAALGQTAVPVLKDVALTHNDVRVRKAVLEILTGLDPKCAADVALLMSKDGDAEIQRTGVSAARHLDDPRTYDVLAQGLKAKDAAVRQDAVEGMGVRGDSRAVPALESTMKNEKEDITVRRHAARSLQLITGRNYNSEVRSGQ
jgi:HEAT repeat protein